MGILVLQGDGTAYDLDAVKTGWAPLANHTWITQNIMYDPTGYNGAPLIDIAGSPYTNVVMSGSGPWTYANCAAVHYGANPSTVGPNAVTGASLKVGEGICVRTRNTAIKSDGNHFALLVIKKVTQEQVTVDVTVWY